jgi:hypothetical protein
VRGSDYDKQEMQNNSTVGRHIKAARKELSKYYGTPISNNKRNYTIGGSKTGSKTTPLKLYLGQIKKEVN